tara:strand:- start:136 stop:339 length:204 start_codon:yes stop_codon:yes gene_type:complete
MPLAVSVVLATMAGATQAQQLEEVIVTAQKCVENLQDVPISVSTLSGEKIQDNTILNFGAGITIFTS